MNAEIQDAVTLARDAELNTPQGGVSTVILGMAEDHAADSQLEQRITDACTRLTMSVTQDELYENFEQLRRLVAQRSPDQVARMERHRGLRR